MPDPGSRLRQVHRISVFNHRHESCNDDRGKGSKQGGITHMESGMAESQSAPEPAVPGSNALRNTMVTLFWE